MTEDDKLLMSLIDPNEMLSPYSNSKNTHNEAYSTTKRTNSLQRNAGGVYTATPSKLAMQPPLNQRINTSSAYFSSER